MTPQNCRITELQIKDTFKTIDANLDFVWKPNFLHWPMIAKFHQTELVSSPVWWQPPPLVPEPWRRPPDGLHEGGQRDFRPLGGQCLVHAGADSLGLRTHRINFPRRAPRQPEGPPILEDSLRPKGELPTFKNCLSEKPTTMLQVTTLVRYADLLYRRGMEESQGSFSSMAGVWLRRRGEFSNHRFLRNLWFL